MKEVIISTESNVLQELKRLVDERLGDFQWDVKVHGDRCEDALLKLELDNRVFRFAVECKLKPSVQDVDRLAGRNRQENALPLLATVRLTDSLVDHCKHSNVSCIDLNGRIWIRAEGVLIDTNEQLKRPVFRTAESPVAFFSRKGSRLARVLLAYRGRTWKQSELAEQTELSQGLLSRLLKHASSQGWVKGEGSRANWRVLDPDALLDAWEKADRWEKRTTIRQYSTLEADFSKLAIALLGRPVGEIAFTQWFAANLRFPYTEPPVLSAYLRSFPDDETLAKLQLREVSQGGKLWIIIPTDPGVFQAQRNLHRLPLVSDAQVYLDLLQVGLRGPDQAQELRKWEGFCT